jgi:hypothetical protein
VVDQEGIRNCPREGSEEYEMGAAGIGGRPWRGVEPGSELMSGAGLEVPVVVVVAVEEVERSEGL